MVGLGPHHGVHGRQPPFVGGSGASCFQFGQHCVDAEGPDGGGDPAGIADQGGQPRRMQPTASLAVLIYNFAGMPFENQIELAWAASLVLVLMARRSRASLRHLILTALFAFLLLLPAVQSIAPALQIPVPATKLMEPIAPAACRVAMSRSSSLPLGGCHQGPR